MPATLVNVSQDTMTQNNDAPSHVRRAVAVTVGAMLGVPASSASPAAAIPSDWEAADNPSTLMSLLTIAVPVLAILAVITLLTYLPSMMRRRGPGPIAYDDPEWFGGPRTGVRAEDEGVAEHTGGSGGRW